MGDVQVPGDALYGAQTQRAVDNFHFSGQPLPQAFIRAVALIKQAAAGANRELGLLPAGLAQAIETAAQRVADGEFADQFPVDVYQTGSGTSTNMNVNEVLARLASDSAGVAVSPNDHVNMGQSSNDVIPSAIHVSAAIALQERLLPALEELQQTIAARAADLQSVVKTGRTHLMDAMPLTMAQELQAWQSQIAFCRETLQSGQQQLLALAQGGTAVGTGINAHPELASRLCARLQQTTGLGFHPGDNRFALLAGQERALLVSGQLKTLAAALIKIANDLRWMNSGPLAGLGEIALPALQPGSSIMPGKVNPVIPEAVCMSAAQVIGYDAAITVAAQSGNFQLNVMLPLVANNLLQGIDLLSNAAVSLARQAIDGFTVNHANLEQALTRNPVLVTALNAEVGYLKAAAIAKRAYAENRPILEVAREETGLPEERLQTLLDPALLTAGGIPGSDR
ncbi:lyase family protein [Pseudomaricurvus sp. HS19]|uniref:class II fumarate hydratase n=1 Tax=Pseudomaricurvus sp. HS19 TaxID=2692626 RepID=UPI001368F0EF|nr:class II fumarate hydratase [Pseudomaricurvus sp. HS19]MYM64436.1 aspartate ammonia-lyase [Pseudomaricurvus sp. HS19]